MKRRMCGWIGWSVLCACIVVARASAQEQPAKQPANQPANQSAEQQSPSQLPVEAKKPGDAHPTLDELLGLPDSSRPRPEKPAAREGDAGAKGSADGAKPRIDPTQADLDRRLGEERVADDFVDAVELMRLTSERLTGSGDTGLETQRMQEETLRKLDRLIEQARRNKKKQNKSQQSQSQSQSEQSQQQAQSSQQQQGQQAGQQSGQTAQGGNVAQEAARPNPGAAGASASWGDLPPHVREALLQGVSDRFSSTYERLTQEYYKRLAEQRATTAPAPADGGGL